MWFESKTKRVYWQLAFLGLVPDAIIGIIVAFSTDSGLLGVIGTVIALQIIYFLFWIKNSIWNWIVFQVGGREQLSEVFYQFLSENRFPDPGNFQVSAERYFDAAAQDEQLPLEIRLKAAGIGGWFSFQHGTNRIQESVRLSMACEDAIARYSKSLRAHY